MRQRGSSMRILICVSLLVCVDGVAAVDEDVVLAMPFGEGQGDTTADLSPHGHDGVLEGAAWDQGKFGGALRFDHLEIGWVDLGIVEALILSETDFTLAVWANMALIVHQHAFVAQDEGPGLENKFIFRYRGDQTLINFVVHNEKTGQTAQINSDLWVPEADRWYQIVIVRSDDDFTFYVDATALGHVENDVILPAAIDASFMIGWSEGPIAMSGLIDEVLVVKRAMEMRDIASHFAGGVQRVLSVDPRDSLVATWGDLKWR